MTNDEIIDQIKMLGPEEFRNFCAGKMNAETVRSMHEAINDGDWSIESKAYENTLTMREQALLCGLLIEYYPSADQDCKKMITQAIDDAINTWWLMFEEFIVLLIRNHDTECSGEIIRKNLDKVLFIRALLQSMKKLGNEIREWLEWARERMTMERKFAESESCFEYEIEEWKNQVNELLRQFD